MLNDILMEEILNPQNINLYTPACYVSSIDYFLGGGIFIFTFMYQVINLEQKMHKDFIKYHHEFD